MFSTEARLRERTGHKGTPRRLYLQDLVDEFQNTASIRTWPETARSALPLAR